MMISVSVIEVNQIFDHLNSITTTAIKLACIHQHPHQKSLLEKYLIKTSTNDNTPNVVNKWLVSVSLAQCVFELFSHRVKQFVLFALTCYLVRYEFVLIELWLNEDEICTMITLEYVLWRNKLKLTYQEIY